MPYFGPLSADEPTLKGLSRIEALKSIRRQIRQAIQHVTPPKPDKRPPHNPLHKETGPWLCLGLIGAGNHKDAGRWYQTCMTCEPVILQFVTPPLDEQYIRSCVARNLFNMYHEIQLYLEDEEDGAAIVITD